MGYLRNIDHLKGRSDFEFHEVDVRDLEKMREVFREADCIVHLAAYKIPRYGKAIDTLEINSIGGKHVLELGRDGNRRIIIASTSDIYGKNPNLPFHEDSDSVIGSTTIPRWSYAVSKLFDEHMAMAYQSSYGVPVTILRFFGSYGPRQHLSWWGGPQSVFISAILKGESLEIHGDGTQTRSFTYISDLVDGIARATEYDREPSIIFNLGNTQEVTILDLAKLVHPALCPRYGTEPQDRALQLDRQPSMKMCLAVFQTSRELELYWASTPTWICEKGWGPRLPGRRKSCRSSRNDLFNVPRLQRSRQSAGTARVPAAVGRTPRRAPAM